MLNLIAEVYWSAVYGGLSGILVALLAINVSRLRMKHAAPWGDKGKHDMIGAIRAHANAVEFIPLFLILFFVWELQGTSRNVLAGVGGAFVASRFAHAIGMITVMKIPRQLGALVSYICLLIVSIGVLLAVV